MKLKYYKYSMLILTGVVAVIFAYPVLGFVRSSPNYRIQVDSLNVGGIREFSVNYRAEDTIGEIGTDESQSTNYKLKAGYQQMLQTYLAISAPADVTLPIISGIGPSGATGDAVWTVTTDNPAGYSLTISASTSPALQCNDGLGGCNDGIDNFADYTPTAPGTPDFIFSVSSNSSEFGFTPEGQDIIQKFLDNGSSCGVGFTDTNDACWLNLSTSEQTIANSSFPNHPSGTATTVTFQTGIGSSYVQTAGIYKATITVTAIPN